MAISGLVSVGIGDVTFTSLQVEYLGLDRIAPMALLRHRPKNFCNLTMCDALAEFSAIAGARVGVAREGSLESYVSVGAGMFATHGRTSATKHDRIREFTWLLGMGLEWTATSWLRPRAELTVEGVDNRVRGQAFAGQLGFAITF